MKLIAFFLHLSIPSVMLISLTEYGQDHIIPMKESVILQCVYCLLEDSGTDQPQVWPLIILVSYILSL